MDEQNLSKHNHQQPKSNQPTHAGSKSKRLSGAGQKEKEKKAELQPHTRAV
jgi:hypothetical protein